MRKLITARPDASGRTAVLEGGRGNEPQEDPVAGRCELEGCWRFLLGRKSVQLGVGCTLVSAPLCPSLKQPDVSDMVESTAKGLNVMVFFQGMQMQLVKMVCWLS